jgi:hypothetical protein
MALNCKINEQLFTFNGKEYNYNEFRALMYDGLLERVPELTTETKEALATEEGKAEVAEKLTKEQIRERFKGGLRGMSATTGRPQAEGETPVDAQAFMDAAKASGAFNAGGAKASDFIDKVFPPEIRKRYSMLYDLIAQSGVRIVMSNGLSARSGSFYAYTAGVVFIDPAVLRLAPSMEDVAEGVNHELIHALGASVDSRVIAKMQKDLEGVFEILSKNRDNASEGVKAILDYIESSSKENLVAEFDEKGNIAREQRDFEEIITYAFTNREFAEFLNSIEWDGAGKQGAKTLFDKLKELILELFNNLGLSSTALDRVTDIVNEYFTEEGFKSRFPTAERQFADAGVSMKDEAFDGIEDPKTPIGDTKTVTVDGKERTALNSNGKPIHPTVEGVRNFWRWFGDSKVVDAEGRPLVVYHGTPNGGFSVFDVAMAGKTHDSGWIGRGIYMTTDQRAAYGYANRKRGESPQIYELYAKLENPLLWGEKDYGAYGLVSFGKELPHGLGDVVYEKLAYRFDPKEKMSSAAEKTLVDQISRVIRAELIRRGHDGVITTYPDDGYEAMVLNPNQIKSATGNYGTFDPANPSIRRMAGPREGKVIKDVDEYIKYTDAGLAAIESLSERAFSQLSDSEVATRMADAAVAAMKKSDWFKGQDIKQQRAAIRELRGEIADRLGVKLAPKTEKQQQRAEDAAFKLGQKLSKKEEARRNKELIDDFAEWKAKQKAKTKAEKQALEEKYAEKFGKHRDEVRAIIKEQKKKLAEAKTNIKTAMAAANEAVSKAVAGISAARKAGEASARRKASLEQSQMAAAVVAIIKENRIKGNLSFRQASMLMSAAAKVNFSNVKSIERFMDLLDKVIDDIAYANQISNIRKKQKIARGKIPAADAARVKQFVGVNAKKIDESLLYDYEQALDDLNLKVPRLAKMDAIYSQVVIDKPKTDIDTDSIKDRLNKLIDSLENLDVEDVDSYKEAIRLVNSIRRKTNEALLSEAITQVEAEEILKDIPDTQEKFDKAFGSQIDAIKKDYIAQIGISAGKVDTTGMSPEVKNLVDSATSLTSEQLNDLSPFDLDLLADLLDVIASEGTVHVNMLASVVARAETAGQGQRIADQLQFAPSVKLTEGGWVRQKVRMASKRSVAFWESALGLSKVKAGAVYKFIFAEIQRASVDSDKLVNAASLEFMRLRDKYKLEPGILGGPDPMVKLGMIITYLQEYDLSNSQMAQNNPDKGYGSRDWFGKGEMDKYMGDAISTKKVKAMINFWNAMPKDENGNVSPKAVHDSFIKGDSRFLTENELGFLNELLAWKESNITPMQKFANELRGKGLDTIKYHMPRIRINSKSKEIPANKFFDSGARRITIESMSGRERKDFSVGPVETDLTKLFINNVDSVSVDYFYTQSVMKINDVLASAEKLSPDKLKAEEYVKAIRQVAADALNHEFSHAKLNKYIRRVLTVRSVGILFGPLRPLQELLTAIISIPFRTGSPAKVYAKMGKAVAEYEQWFKKNEYVLDVMERSKSAMTNRDGFNKIYEFKRDGYEKKTKFEKLAFALTSWPERTQINISWMPVFEQEFRREAGVAFDQAAYKLDPEAYFKKHKQAFLAASATADNSYQKIVGPSTQFGARKKVGILGVDVETNSNAGMMLSWMSNWPSRSWWQLKDATTGFVMAEREARLTGYAVGDVRTDAASQALGVANETLVYSFLTNLRLIYGKAMATTIGILAASVVGDEDDDDEELSRVWDEANKEAMAGFAPSNLIQGGANSVISLATSPTGAVGREIYGLTVNLLLTAAESKMLGMDKQDAKFLREYMEKYMFKYGAMDISTRYAGEDAVQKALYNTLPALSGAVSQVYAVADAYKIAIPSMMKKIENGEELTLNEKEVYALLSLTINSANLYGMLAGGVALPFGQDANRMMKDLQKKHPGGQGLLLDRIPSEFIVE